MHYEVYILWYKMREITIVSSSTVLTWIFLKINKNLAKSIGIINGTLDPKSRTFFFFCSYIANKQQITLILK